MLIKDLSFAFDKQHITYFFNRVTLTFDGPGLYFIEGENGIGKSTFFHIVQGTVDKQALVEGTIILDNTTYSLGSLALHKKVHMVHQQYDLMIANRFSFAENLQFANLPTYPSLHALPQATISKSNMPLNIDMNKPAYLLSGGQRQLLAIMMALQRHPAILLLDEPTATLDTQNAHLIMNYLTQLAHDTGIIIMIICHDRALAKQYARARFCIRKIDNNMRTIEPYSVDAI